VSLLLLLLMLLMLTLLMLLLRIHGTATLTRDNESPPPNVFPREIRPEEGAGKASLQNPQTIQLCAVTFSRHQAAAANCPTARGENPPPSSGTASFIATAAAAVDAPTIEIKLLQKSFLLQKSLMSNAADYGGGALVPETIKPVLVPVHLLIPLRLSAFSFTISHVQGMR
jgi:hypothetical protein